MTQETRVQEKPKPDGVKVIEVKCTVDLEHTHESLHAYVDLDGIKVAPGDQVIVHDAPTEIGFGEKTFVERRATVIRATPFQRFLAHLEGYMELTELYEVSFSPGRAS
jgi:hypothetical protein